MIFDTDITMSFIQFNFAQKNVAQWVHNPTIEYYFFTRMLANKLNHIHSFLIISDMHISNWFLSDLCYLTREKPINGTSVFLHNPASSDTSNSTVLSWNTVSCETTNSDHFLTPDSSESHRKPTDPESGSDRFRLYESGRNSVNPISGYQRKPVDSTGIR